MRRPRGLPGDQNVFEDRRYSSIYLFVSSRPTGSSQGVPDAVILTFLRAFVKTETHHTMRDAMRSFRTLHRGSLIDNDRDTGGTMANTNESSSITESG